MAIVDLNQKFKDCIIPEITEALKIATDHHDIKDYRFRSDEEFEYSMVIITTTNGNVQVNYKKALAP